MVLVLWLWCLVDVCGEGICGVVDCCGGGGVVVVLSKC